MSDVPPGIELPRHRRPEGGQLGYWLKRSYIALLAVFAVAALANVFGQEATTDKATATAASLEVTAPTRLRGGLLYQATFRLHAFRHIAKPTLVLAHGWFEDTTVNTTAPEPTSEKADAGHVYLEFEPMEPGTTVPVLLDFQANPTNVGSHDTTAAFYDGQEPLVSVDRSQFNFP